MEDEWRVISCAGCTHYSVENDGHGIRQEAEEESKAKTLAHSPNRPPNRNLLHFTLSKVHMYEYERKKGGNIWSLRGRATATLTAKIDRRLSVNLGLSQLNSTQLEERTGRQKLKRRRKAAGHMYLAT